MDKLEKESNGNNSKITLYIILLIFLVITLIIFQLFIYITTKESIEGVEERLNTISSVAYSAKSIAELPLRRNIDSEISSNDVIDDEEVAMIQEYCREMQIVFPGTNATIPLEQLEIMISN